VSYLIVLVASGCTLILELVAGRVLAPFVGVSIHTWTSIIGVVLAGISLGNYLGGVLADRAGPARMLAVLLAAGGLASVAVLPLASGLGALAPRSYPLVFRIVLLTTLLFFLPSVLLGMVPPVAIKHALDDLAQAGKVVGRVYAASTVGSLVGTFLTVPARLSGLSCRT
jgi:predicted membrane-bound spermidine synthase